MKRLLYLLPLLLIACKTTKVATESSDSVRVEIRHHTVFVPDSIFVEIPPQTAYIFTPDSFSHLENDYAVSDASIESGFLRHSLSTKPQKKAVEVMKQIEYKDSIVFKDRNVYVTKTETVYKLRRWQKMLVVIDLLILFGLSITLFSFIRARRP